RGHAEFAFERLDALADGRLGQSEGAGGGGEARPLGGLGERLKVWELGVHVGWPRQVILPRGESRPVAPIRGICRRAGGLDPVVVGGMDLREIAAATGIPLGEVETSAGRLRGNGIYFYCVRCVGCSSRRGGNRLRRRQ